MSIVSSPHAEQAMPEDPERETLVAEYLRQHPQFFIRHPEILAALQVPHPTGGAVSLIEQQVRVLRKQLETERHRLAHLIARAREYEALASRLHGLVLQLILVKDPAHLCHLIRDGVRHEFHAEAVTLKLFQVPETDDEPADPLTALFRDFVDRDHALCGPLDEEKSARLFGGAGTVVKTAALIPIRTEGQSGVLAIGSADPERFHPDMGTELLDRLGEVVSHKLRAVPLDPGEHF